MRYRLSSFVAAALVVASVDGAQRTLTLRDIDDAILAGQTRLAADRARFHAPYRVLVNQAPVDYVDVVTPYRRVVLAADERAQLGDRSFGQRQALALLNDAAGRFDFVVELTFHPLNTYITVPEYTVMLVHGASRIAPAAIDRQPRFGARVDGLPPAVPVAGGRIVTRGAQPLLGGTVTARFDGDALDTGGVMQLAIGEQGKELVRVTIDLGKLR